MTNSTPLSLILENKRFEVAARESAKPLESFKNSLQASQREFKGGFILECKKASPSEGLIRPDFDIRQIAQTYAPFASAISVLTDQKFFQGSFGYLTQVRNQVSCPVLCKDFIISPYQVYEARFYQADMILLMLSVLDDASYQACAKVAQALNMQVLTEVHDASELQRAIKLGAEIIGVNNRDFKTLKVSLDVSRKLLPMIPKDKIKIIESGIQTHADILEFKNQADGFLIGTSLMKEPHLDLALRDLIFGRVKICGLTSVQDAKMAYEAGAGFGGLIFTSESPRCVEFEIARQMIAKIPWRWVGVFVNAPVSQVVDYAQKLGLFSVQLHGEESDAYLKELRDLLYESVEIWKTSPPNPLSSNWRGGVTRFLFDTPHTKLHGGTGQRFDWSLIPTSIPKERVILSGGLNPSNFHEAEKLGFWALDVNSGVEKKPGVKSVEKLKQLLR